MTGKIIKGIGGFYYVKASDNSVYECKARGLFRKEGITPMIGDDVEIDVNGGKGSIVKILLRRNSMIRPPVANIDALVLVAAAASPEPSLFLIDKMLVNAEINGIEPIVCINKSDIKRREDLVDIYSTAGYNVVEVSALEESGLDALLPYIQGKTAAFSGLSGVGKSSILNLITDADMETGSVSEKIQRGRHTTRHVELMSLKCGGAALDTPGFSSLEVEGIRADELWKYFPEMADCGDKCRFRGCSHINEPDCAVKELIDDGKLAPSRYESYKELYNSLKLIKEWERK